MVRAIIRTFCYPEYQEMSDAFGLSSAVILPPNAQIVTISGQTGVVNGIHAATEAEQVSIAFDNVTKALLHAVPEYETAADAWASVAELTTYHVKMNFGGELGPAIAKACERTLGTHRPAWTAVGVETLFAPDVLFEIQVKAVLPDLRKSVL